MGPSGCGKTTLLRLIAGLERPDAGRIFMDGVEVTDAALRDRRIGFVYQQYALFPHLSIAENVGELLELVRLSGYEKRLPRELSGGERQRVALARALASEPRSLLLDEPFSALDVHVRKHLRRRLREIHERAKLTTIMVTHDIDEAMKLADHPANSFVEQFIGGA